MRAQTGLNFSFVVSAYTMRHAAREASETAVSDTDDATGLDQAQRAELKSLFASLPEEPGWTVLVSGRENQDVLLRRMFRDEINRELETLRKDNKQ